MSFSSGNQTRLENRSFSRHPSYKPPFQPCFKDFPATFDTGSPSFRGFVPRGPPVLKIPPPDVVFGVVFGVESRFIVQISSNIHVCVAKKKMLSSVPTVFRPHLLWSFLWLKPQALGKWQMDVAGLICFFNQNPYLHHPNLRPRGGRKARWEGKGRRREVWWKSGGSGCGHAEGFDCEITWLAIPVPATLQQEGLQLA